MRSSLAFICLILLSHCTVPVVNPGGILGGGTAGVGGQSGNSAGATPQNQAVCDAANICDGKCVDTQNDPQNCGTCGTVCDASESCTGGACEKLGCGRGISQCTNKCVDLQNDPANCGKCGKACQAIEVCSKGKCGSSCGNGVSQCGNVCVDMQNDATNCGGCGIACKEGEVCTKGACTLTCGTGTTKCGSACVDVNNDPSNCSQCGKKCGASEVCTEGACGSSCGSGTEDCSGVCVDTSSDTDNCGACGTACTAGEICQWGECQMVCGGNTVKCGDKCVDPVNDGQNCGGCGQVCDNGKICINGGCSALQCAPGNTWCALGCVNLKTSNGNCGACGNVCPANNVCKNGACTFCDSATTDCDGDGWKVSEGDCCDRAGTCGAEPEKVNPGAIEVVGNGADDNCNGQTDLFDTQDTIACDSGLTSNSVAATDYAKAIGICRSTTLNPAAKKDKTWGLLDAKIVRADGSAISGTTSTQLAIRPGFGTSIAPLEGSSLAVLSSGVAADSNDTAPGPNGGAPGGANVDNRYANQLNIETCTSPLCIKDWFNAAKGALKAAKALPVAPNCGSGTAGYPSWANDSVRLVLTLRAPTNARAFSFNSFFFSSEYPEYVCSEFNDQYVALVDTPSGTPSPIPNPVDKNLMTYTSAGKKWPIGINVAGGTDLFAVCRPRAGTSDQCWNTSVSPQSCQLGQNLLAGTGFEKPTADPCNIGGATFWLTTAGNVIPGEIVQVRIVIWDVGDDQYDSAALIDGFQWLSNATLPGTN